MTQENGMPMEFELIDKKTGEIASNDLWRIDFVTGKLVYNEFFYVLRQAIGATSSDDPPQELYLGDLIEVQHPFIENVGAGKSTGVIIWQDFAVQVKLLSGGHLHFVPFTVVKNCIIKKLGSNHDPKMKEILKKAGLKDEL